VSTPGPRRSGLRAFRPRLDENVDADQHARALPAQALLPFAEPITSAEPDEPRGAPGARAMRKYPRMKLDDLVPDVRDGLTRPERIVLWMLYEAQKEFPGRNVPTALLYGRVVEHINLTVPEFQNILSRMVGGR
jgi:hypothetical protein